MTFVLEEAQNKFQGFDKLLERHENIHCRDTSPSTFSVVFIGQKLQPCVGIA